jgi:ADP-ribose pyrophosphatase YjhB (NUDIX family)
MTSKNLSRVRPTGVLIENGQLLIVKQDLSPTRKWSLPGGKMEPGESLEETVLREVFEETGLTARVVKLLYITEKAELNPGLIHITFLLERVSGEIQLPTNEYDSLPISDVRFVPLEDLTNYDFSDKFMELARAGFPDSGSYKGDKGNIGL